EFLDDQRFIELVLTPITGERGLPGDNHAWNIGLDDNRRQLSLVINPFTSEPSTKGKPYGGNFERKQPVLRHVADIDPFTANEIVVRLLVSRCTVVVTTVEI